MRALRKEGVKCGVVERFLAHVGPHGIRNDLFGIIDIIALDPETGVRGIQCCGGSGFSAHRKKLTIERQQESYDWLSTPGTTLEIWAWRKVKLKPGSKAVRWKPRIVAITLDDLENA